MLRALATDAISTSQYENSYPLPSSFCMLKIARYNCGCTAPPWGTATATLIDIVWNLSIPHQLLEVFFEYVVFCHVGALDCRVNHDFYTNVLETVTEVEVLTTVCKELI